MNIYAKQSALSSAVLQHQLKIIRYKSMRVLAVHIDCSAEKMTLSLMLSMPSHMQIHAAAYCKLWKMQVCTGAVQRVLSQGTQHKKTLQMCCPPEWQWVSPGRKGGYNR